MNRDHPPPHRQPWFCAPPGRNFYFDLYSFVFCLALFALLRDVSNISIEIYRSGPFSAFYGVAISTYGTLEAFKNTSHYDLGPIPSHTDQWTGLGRSSFPLDSDIGSIWNDTARVHPIIPTVSLELLDLAIEREQARELWTAFDESLSDGMQKISQSFHLYLGTGPVHSLFCRMRRFWGSPCPMQIPRVLISVQDEMHLAVTELRGRVLHLMRQEGHIARYMDEMKRLALENMGLGSKPESLIALRTFDRQSRRRIQATLALVVELHQESRSSILTDLRVCSDM
ncbi:hypothetical protein PLICRDRAFT_30503 [Plicaturopsis crispa FD-325 SS-3]|nr:hypothetical protein PLICRDRAFT_30503 [Plicaturopsis crispa FD-325 SS-3]